MWWASLFFPACHGGITENHKDLIDKRMNSLCVCEPLKKIEQANRMSFSQQSTHETPFEFCNHWDANAKWQRCSIKLKDIDLIICLLIISPYYILITCLPATFHTYVSDWFVIFSKERKNKKEKGIKGILWLPICGDAQRPGKEKVAFN